jgi:hypothetical protein
MAARYMATCLTVHSSGSGRELAKLLAPHFTVYGFDRGRGHSGDTLPYR